MKCIYHVTNKEMEMIKYIVSHEDLCTFENFIVTDFCAWHLFINLNTNFEENIRRKVHEIYTIELLYID